MHIVHEVNEMGFNHCYPWLETVHLSTYIVIGNENEDIGNGNDNNLHTFGINSMYIILKQYKMHSN